MSATKPAAAAETAIPLPGNEAQPAPEAADETSRAAAFLERQIAETAPDMAADLRRTLAHLGASIAKKTMTEGKQPEPKPEPATAPAPQLPAAAPIAKILQFPLPFGDDTRAVSNPLARGALFAAVKERQFFRDYVTVYEQRGMKVEFTGEQLNQDDHDTYLQLVKMALHKPIGADITQAVNAVLRGLSRKTRESHRSQVFEEMSRLVRTTVRLTTPNYRYEGHLLDDASTPHDQTALPQYRRHLAYRLNPRFARFYDKAAFTLFDCQERLKLKGRGSELAKWLHLWIIGNAEQYPHKVETIRQLCGSKDKTLYSFRQKLRQGLDLLKEAGIITAWCIDQKSDLVTIERTPSPAQINHLISKEECPTEERTAPFPERHLKPETVERFRSLWPRLDPYACQADFDAWLAGKTPPRDYDPAFLGFAKKWTTGKA